MDLSLTIALAKEACMNGFRESALNLLIDARSFHHNHKGSMNDNIYSNDPTLQRLIKRRDAWLNRPRHVMTLHQITERRRFLYLREQKRMERQKALEFRRSIAAPLTLVKG